MRRRTISATGNERKLFGFTLLEVITVLIIMSIFFALSIPLFSKFIEGAKLDVAARSVASVLRTARSFAITRNVNYYVVFNTVRDPNEYFDSLDGVSPIEKRYKLPRGVWFYKPGSSDPISDAVEFTNDIARFRPSGELDETGSRSVFIADDRAQSANSQEINVERTTGRIEIE